MREFLILIGYNAKAIVAHLLIASAKYFSDNKNKNS